MNNDGKDLFLAEEVFLNSMYFLLFKSGVYELDG